MSTVRSGYTGPSKKIGGSSDYHVDFKILKSLPIAEQVKAFDTLATRYGQNKRNIEFSNAGVSRDIYNPNLPFSERAALLQRAAGAHAPSSADFNSYDFYVPFKGQSRFKPGAVEDASIYLPTIAGGKVRRGSGGGYGYFSEALDPSGKVLYRVGHGNVDRPESDGGLTVPQVAALPPPAAQGSTFSQRQQDQLLGAGSALNFLSNYLGRSEKKASPYSGLISSLLQQQRDPTEEFLMSYVMGSNPNAAM